MRFLTRLALVGLLAVPALSVSAELWSGCVTIVSASDYLAYNNSISIVVSPALSGCTADGIPGSVAFTVGQDGVSSSNVDGFLAAGLSAYAAGHKVMIYYDNGTGSCNGAILAVGGYYGQCL